MLSCHPQTISNIIQKLEKQGDNFKYSKGIQMLSTEGIRLSTLIMEDEFPLILNYICTSKRIKQQTRTLQKIKIIKPSVTVVVN